MTLSRAEAFSFLNKLATASTPLFGFVVGPLGLSVFIGSITDLTTDYLIITQSADRSVLPMMAIMLNDSVSYQYGDIREITNLLPSEVFAQKELKAQLNYLKSAIEGGIALLNQPKQHAIVLVELNPEAVNQSS